MYAMTKHIKKAMAAFLCACLLLSYNPAAGMVPSAEAIEEVAPIDSPVPPQSSLNASVDKVDGLDYGDDSDMSHGTATTDVNITTFDGSLQTKATPSFSATLTQMSETPNLKLVVVALSPQATGLSDYQFSWTLKRNGELATPEIEQILNSSDVASKSYNSGNYANTKNCLGLIDLSYLFTNVDTAYFADNYTYTFTCKTKCISTGEEAENVIEVVTVDSSEYKDPESGVETPKDPFNPENDAKASRLDADSKNGTVALIYSEQGGFRTGSDGAHLQSVDMTPSNVQNYFGKLFEQGAHENLPADPTGADYQLGPIQVNNITGAKKLENGSVIPAYVGELTMLIPIDNQTDTTITDAPRYNYDAGDSIYVLYQKPDDTDSPAAYVEAIVVRDPGDKGADGKGKLKAAFVIDEENGPYMPGYFAVAYAPSKVVPVSSTDPTPSQPLQTSYTIKAYVDPENGFGSIESVVDLEKGYWVTGSAASYTFVPRASEVADDKSKITTYNLKTIQFREEVDGSSWMTIYDGTPGTKSQDGMEFVYSGGVLTIKGCAANGAYELKAQFSKDDPDIVIAEIPNPNVYNVYVSMAGADDIDVGNCSVDVTYYDGDAKQITENVAKGAWRGSSPDGGFLIQALKNTTVRFNVNVSGTPSKGKEYYLQEIKTSSGGIAWDGSVSPVSGSTTVKNDVNGMFIYRQFVVGVRDASDVPGPLLQATFKVGDVDGATNGEIADKDVENGTLTRSFAQGAAGSPVTFVGTDSKFYAAYAKVHKTLSDGSLGELLSSHYMLPNSSYDPAYSWYSYTSWPFSVTYTVYFEKIEGIEPLTLDMGDAPDHGTIVPSGWEFQDTYTPGTSLTFGVTPDAGYRLEGNKITVTYTDKTSEELSVVGGFAMLNLKKSVAGISGEFKEISSLDDKPTAISETYNLNIYVADANYEGALGYATGSDVPEADRVGTGDGDVSLPEDGRLLGTINSGVNYPISTKVTATKADGYPSYPLSMQSNSGVVVDKILVVQYNDSDGSKTIEKRKLYYRTWPAFTVEDIRGNTDVVVYFRELTSEEQQNPPYDPDPENGTIDWVTINTAITSGGSTGKATYLGDVLVVKGQGFQNRIWPLGDYRWDRLYYVTDENTVNMTREVAGPTATHMVKLDNIESDLRISALFTNESDPDNPVPEPPEHSYTLTAPSSMQHGSVSAAVGTSSRVPLTTWSDVAEFSTVEFIVEADQNYKISDLNITLGNLPNDDMKVFVNTNDTSHGAARQTIKFATTADADAGWQEFTDPELLKQGLGSNTTSTVWYVENLNSDVLIEAAFAAVNPDDIPDLKPENYWTVDATIAAGQGSILCTRATNGWPMKVMKAKEGEESQTRTIYVTADRDYKIKDVIVKRSTDNLLLDAWEALAGWFGGTDKATQLATIIANGRVDLTVDANYQITVEFEKDTNKTTDAGDDFVTVNVKSDTLKGKVSPSSSVQVAKSGDNSTQQFIVSPNQANNGKYYSVESVSVTYTENNATKTTTIPVKPSDGNKVLNGRTLLTWDTSYANVFTVDVSALGLNRDNLSAVTVEVTFKDEADVTGSFGDTGSSQTPPASVMKEVSVSVNVDSAEDGFSSNAGGVVAPLGKFFIMPDGEHTKQLVLVSPDTGYELEKIVVTNDEGEEISALGTSYFDQVAANNGYFYVDATSKANENIVIYFKQQEKIEGDFTVDVVIDGKGKSVPNTGGAATNTTRSPILVKAGKTASFNLIPTDYNTAVMKVVDQYWNGSEWKEVDSDVPNRIGYERPDGNLDKYLRFEVKPVVIDHHVVNRRIVVTFGEVKDPNQDKVDWGSFPESEKVNINVNIWGNGRGQDKFSLIPYATLKGVYKGSAETSVSYPYTFSVLDDAWNGDSSGAYRIYCVEVNGKILKGDKNNPSPKNGGFFKSGSVEFYTKMVDGELTSNLMSRTDNTLNIYVKKFTWDEINSGVSGGNPNFEGDFFGDGDIVMRTAGGALIAAGTSYASTDASTSFASRAVKLNESWVDSGSDGPGGDGDGDEGPGGDEGDGPGDTSGENKVPSSPENSSVGGNSGNGGENDGVGGNETVLPGGDDNNLPVDWFMVPADGWVIEDVFLYNCTVQDFSWMKPSEVPDPRYADDPREEQVALKYSLRHSDEPGKAFVFVKYGLMNADDREAWKTNPESIYGETKVKADSTKNGLNHTVELAVSPSSALADLNLTVDALAKVPTAKMYPWIDAKVDNNKISYKTVDMTLSSFDRATGNFTIEVGPLIKWNKDNEEESIIYTVDKSKLASGLQLTDMRDQAAIDENKKNTNNGARAVAAAETDASKPEYFAKYKVTGNVKDIQPDGNVFNIEIPLMERDLTNGSYPEFQKKQNTKEEPELVTLTAEVNNAAYGKLVPATVSVDNQMVKWFGDASSASSWELVEGTRVAFDVVPTSDNYVPVAVTRNGQDCWTSGEYSSSLRRVAFTVERNTILRAVFQNTKDARVPVTIQVVGGHGTTSPVPDTYDAVIGQDFDIYFDPDNGYVIDVVTVITDGKTQSYSYSASTPGFKLYGQNLRSATTVRISYKLAGQESGQNPDNPLIHTAGQDLLDSATGLIRTGDSLWMVIALVVVAAGAVTTVMVVRRRKMAAASRAARAAKYSVTPRKRR